MNVIKLRLVHSFQTANYRVSNPFEFISRREQKLALKSKIIASNPRFSLTELFLLFVEIWQFTQLSHLNFIFTHLAWTRCAKQLQVKGNSEHDLCAPLRAATPLEKWLFDGSRLTIYLSFKCPSHAVAHPNDFNVALLVSDCLQLSIFINDFLAQLVVDHFNSCRE